MRPFGSPRQLEKRRRKALELLDLGLSLNEVARRIGCTPPSVMRWRDTREKDGEQGLAPKPVPGRPCKISETQKGKLEKLLLKGAMVCGYRTDLWTTQRIADLIEKKFGVKYHRDNIGRLMKALGWSHQKPERRAIERNEAEIERWKREEWPRIKKTPKTWAPTSSL